MSLEGVVITGSSVKYAACRYLLCLHGALVVLLRLCWLVYDRLGRRKRDGDGDTHVPACPYRRRDQSTLIMIIHTGSHIIIITHNIANKS